MRTSSPVRWDYLGVLRGTWLCLGWSMHLKNTNRDEMKWTSYILWLSMTCFLLPSSATTQDLHLPNLALHKVCTSVESCNNEESVGPTVAYMGEPSPQSYTGYQHQLDQIVSRSSSLLSPLSPLYYSSSLPWKTKFKIGGDRRQIL